MCACTWRKRERPLTRHDPVPTVSRRTLRMNRTTGPEEKFGATRQTGSWAESYAQDSDRAASASDRSRCPGYRHGHRVDPRRNLPGKTIFACGNGRSALITWRMASEMVKHASYGHRPGSR